MRVDEKMLGEIVARVVHAHVQQVTFAAGAEVQRLIERCEQLDVAVGRVRADLEERIASLPAPRDGIDGKDGRDGIDGKDGAPGAPGERGADGAPGRDGVDGVHGKDGRDGIDGKDGAAGRDGEHGKDGKDALSLEIVYDMDPRKAYPRGTVARFRGGLIRAERRTSPITGPLDGTGWHVIMCGVASDERIVSDDCRTVIQRTTYTDGEVVETRLMSPAIIYREVWREGAYEAGDAVTFGGSLWIALRATSAKPGDGSLDWRLAVKKGRDGRDAPA